MKINLIFRVIYWSILFFPLYSFPGHVFAKSDITTGPPIKLLHPAEGTVVIAKKPLIKCSIPISFDPKRLLVLLDGTDISALLKIHSEGFDYKPIADLPPGHHSVSVTVFTPDGQEIKQEFTFSTRHSKPFEEAYSNNQITTLYEKLIDKSEEVQNAPSWKTESNLASESKLKEKNWELMFRTNVRHFDQQLRAIPPQEKGFGVANYLFQGKYSGSRFNFLGELGDVTINETANTVQALARRGGDLVFQSKDLHLQLRTFAVKSEQLMGFNGGLGIGTTPADHLMGFSGDVGLFSDRLKFKTIYARGGEEGNSFGISTSEGAREGDVLGFLITSDFFKQKLITEAEIDISRFDGDTSDEFSREKDKAYRVKAGGTLGKFNYEGLYEYMGRDYEVIGNPGLQKNREGFGLKGGGDFKNHLINLSVSRYHDNVKKEDLFPVVYTSQGTLDYTFKKYQSLPMGISYQRTMMRSENEPLNIAHIRTDTDTIMGRINYVKMPWNVGLTGSYSHQNDRTEAANDTTAITFTFASSVILERPSISISPGFTFNRSISHLTDVRTDVYTTTLDLRGDLFDKRLTYGFGGTYTISKSSDGSSSQDTVGSNFNLLYLLANNLGGFFSPSVGIRGFCNRTNNRIHDQTVNEFAFFLVIQTKMAFSF